MSVASAGKHVETLPFRQSLTTCFFPSAGLLKIHDLLPGLSWQYVYHVSFLADGLSIAINHQFHQSGLMSFVLFYYRPKIPILAPLLLLNPGVFLYLPSFGRLFAPFHCVFLRSSQLKSMYLAINM